MSSSRLRILVSGMMAGVPGHGGATWAVLQYVLGLRRLGHEVRFVEPVEWVENGSNGRSSFPSRSVRYFRNVTTRYGLTETATLLRADGQETVGAPYRELLRFADEADLLLNLSGMLRDPEILSRVPLKVYVDLDPAFTQLWESVDGIDMGLDGHDRFLTVGLSLGRPQCPIPTCERDWIPTVQPVVLEEWPRASRIDHNALTTVANWRGYSSIEHDGVHYGQKAHSLRQLISLPERAPDTFLLALAIDAEGDGRDLGELRRHGWRLVPPELVAATPRSYQAFVQGSAAEFGLAKTGYVNSRCGWFSDRSICYLASGRPVLAQETGFSDHLPVGEGLLAFETEEDVLAGVDRIREDYAGHAKAARDLADALFDSDRVLERILELVGSGNPSRMETL